MNQKTLHRNIQNIIFLHCLNNSRQHGSNSSCCSVLNTMLFNLDILKFSKIHFLLQLFFFYFLFKRVGVVAQASKQVWYKPQTTLF